MEKCLLNVERIHASLSTCNLVYESSVDIGRVALRDFDQRRRAG